MTPYRSPKTEFLKSCFASIWLNSFLTSSESLERCHDALALELPGVSYGALDLDVFEFLSFLKESKVSSVRVHLPVSGNLDGLVDTSDYLDHALAVGEVITFEGMKNFALVPTAEKWLLFPLNFITKLPQLNWRQVDRNLAEFLPQVSHSLEAFDLIASNQAAREIIITLDHNISKLEFPSAQPARVTFLLGRLMRTLVIGELAKTDFAYSASITKNRLFKDNVEELIARSRSYLSQVSNYHWQQ